MKKRKTNNTLKRSILLIPSVFALVSCWGNVRYWLNEEGRKEFCSNMEFMRTEKDFLIFYSPKVNDSEYTFEEWENFDMFICEKQDDGFFHLRKDSEEADMEKQIANEGTTYDFGVASLEKHGYKNAFTVKEILPFVKESAKKAKDIKGVMNSSYYYFDMEQSVFDSFKDFRASHFNSRLNKAIDEEGSLYISIYNFQGLGLYLGSVNGTMTENGVLKWVECAYFVDED